MQQLSATEIRRQMLSLLDHLPDEGIVITRRGLPLAKLVPIKQEKKKGKLITGPLIVGKGSPGPRCPTTENPDDLILG